MGKWKPGQPPPRAINRALMIRILESHGWTNELGGNHVVKMTKPGHRPITLPQHKDPDYGAGLRAAILKQAELDS